MGVAGIWKKIKNGVKKVASKVGEGLKNVGKKIVNTGAKVVKTVADLSGKAWDVIGKVGQVASKVLPGAGKLIGGAANIASKIYGKITDTASNLAQKVIDKTSDKKVQINTNGKITNMSYDEWKKLPANNIIVGPGGKNPLYNQKNQNTSSNSNSNQTYNAMKVEQSSFANSKPTYSTYNNQQKLYDKVGRTVKPTTTTRNLNAEPDVVVNNYYNSGPRRDYVEHRHPSNRNYQPRNIGPRRMDQPPIYNQGIPMDIQRQSQRRQQPNQYTYSEPVRYTRPIEVPQNMYNQPQRRVKSYAEYIQPQKVVFGSW